MLTTTSDVYEHLWMILLGIKLSGHQSLLPLGIRQQYTLVTLWALFRSLFSIEETLSTDATAHVKVSNNLGAVIAFGKFAATYRLALIKQS